MPAAPQTELDEARAIDALRGAAAPHIGRADHLFGELGGVAVLRADFDKRRQRQVAVRGREPFARGLAHHERAARQDGGPPLAASGSLCSIASIIATRCVGAIGAASASAAR